MTAHNKGGWNDPTAHSHFFTKNPDSDPKPVRMTKDMTKRREIDEIILEREIMKQTKEVWDDD